MGMTPLNSASASPSGLSQTGYVEHHSVGIEFGWGQMRIAWQPVNRCGCIPRIAKVVDPVDIARAWWRPCQPMWAGWFALSGQPTIAD